MLSQFKTVISAGRDEIMIDKSLFIGYAMPVENEEEALAFIQQIKEKHKDATHNVPAYMVGQQNEIQRCSDDGEPSGTAGVPILEVLKKEDLRNVAVVVTRYFGGVKLGTGGLVRAYTKGAKIGVEAAGIVTKRLHQVIQLSIDYTLLGMVQNQLRNEGYQVKDTLYDEAVHLFVWVAVEEVDSFQAKLIDWTSGKGVMVLGDLEYLW